MILLVRLISGATLKWWTDQGRSLNDEARRYRGYLRLYRRMQPSEDLWLALSDARDALAAFDLAALKKAQDTADPLLKNQAAGATGHARAVEGFKLRLPKASNLLRLSGITRFWLGIVLVAAYGFKNQYLDRPTFGDGSFEDWFSIGTWGFLAGFSGKTVRDLIGTR